MPKITDQPYCCDLLSRTQTTRTNRIPDPYEELTGWTATPSGTWIQPERSTRTWACYGPDSYDSTCRPRLLPQQRLRPPVRLTTQTISSENLRKEQLSSKTPSPPYKSNCAISRKRPVDNRRPTSSHPPGRPLSPSPSPSPSQNYSLLLHRNKHRASFWWVCLWRNHAPWHSGPWGGSKHPGTAVTSADWDLSQIGLAACSTPWIG